MNKWYVYHICKNADIGNINSGYIGVTQNTIKRFSDHSKNDSHVGNAIKKYKLTYDDLHILYIFDSSDAAYLIENKLRPNEQMGWNGMQGGKGYTDDHKHNQYIRAKISNARKGKITRQSDEHYKKLSDSQKGIPREKSVCPFCGIEASLGNMQRWHLGRCKKAPPKTIMINSFDCDGVITLGIYPGPNDIVITGRSFEESEVTLEMFKLKEIHNKVYFNPVPFIEKTRESSGTHKGNIIWELFKQGIIIGIHYDDDYIQLKEIKKLIKLYALPTKTVWVNHGGLEELENVKRDKFGNPIYDLTEKENVRHTKDTE